MAIHDATNMSKTLQTPRPEPPFQVGYSQFKAIRELTKIFYAETKIPNRDTMRTTPDPLMKKSTKLPRVEDQTPPPPRVDPDEESKDKK